MGTIAAPVQLTEPELKLLQTLVYQECGMFFDERRSHFLKDRLQRRLRECHLDSFYSYYRLLISKEGKAELAQLLENLTVNETSFFRKIGERISGTILEVSIQNDDRTLRVRIGITANPLTKYIEDDRRNQSPYCDPSQSRNVALFGRAPVIGEVNPDRTTLEARAFLPDAYCELSTIRFRLSSPALKIPL